MALTLNIGGASPALIQNGTVVEMDTIAVSLISPTLAVASTAGNCLVVILANGSGGGPSLVVSAPDGWVKESSVVQGAQSDLEVWVYPNNPGGIYVVTFQVGSAIWWTHISEWSGVTALGALDASGTATAAAGTTLAPTTSGNVTGLRDVAISVWFQRLAAPGTVTFTTPGGFTRLIDNGALSNLNHVDAEYQLLPASGAPLGPTLTSSGTTASAAGAIITLKGCGPLTNQSAFIRYGSLTIKQNTADFALLDPATVPLLGDPVAFADPTWPGRVT